MNKQQLKELDNYITLQYNLYNQYLVGLKTLDDEEGYKNVTALYTKKTKRDLSLLILKFNIKEDRWEAELRALIDYNSTLTENSKTRLFIKINKVVMDIKIYNNNKNIVISTSSTRIFFYSDSVNYLKIEGDHEVVEL